MELSAMELQQIILLALSLACASLGWFARQVWGAVQQLKQQMADLRARIGEDFVRYDRMQDALKPVMEQLREIQRTLERKADK